MRTCTRTLTSTIYHHLYQSNSRPSYSYSYLPASRSALILLFLPRPLTDPLPLPPPSPTGELFPGSGLVKKKSETDPLLISLLLFGSPDYSQSSRRREEGERYRKVRKKERNKDSPKSPRNFILPILTFQIPFLLSR
jgi:hypothetical protein